MSMENGTYLERSLWSALQHWFQQPLGQLFGAAEQECLEAMLAPLFGQHIIAVGVPWHENPLAGSPIGRRCRLDWARSPAAGLVDAWAEPARLPIAGSCVDVAVLPHVLEFATDPRAVLREVDRVLSADGHVLVLGFNPFSWWGLRRWLGPRRGRAPWQARFLGAAQLSRRLAEWDFVTVAVRYHFHRPPLRRVRLLRFLGFLDPLGAKVWPFWGGGYVLLAKKRVMPLTTIKLAWWRPRRYLLPAGMTQRLINRVRGPGCRD